MILFSYSSPTTSVDAAGGTKTTPSLGAGHAGELYISNKKVYNILL